MMIEKIENILKIFGILYAVNFIVGIFWTIYFWTGKTKSLIDIFGMLCINIFYPFVMIFGAIIVFLPALLFLYLLFKKIKNINLRTVLVAFTIPFTNMIYFFIEYFLDGFLVPYSILIGFYSAAFILPVTFIVLLFVPKSILSFKKQALWGTLLMFVIGWVLIFVSLNTVDSVERFAATQELKKYDSVIDKIESYKNENGFYPETITDDFNTYKNLHYEPQDNNSYILIYNHNWSKTYYYCSDTEYYVCKEGLHNGATHTKIGKWVEAVTDD